ncbi:MAG: PIN domain-containing protein [Haloarculaceae archaeon]
MIVLDANALMMPVECDVRVFEQLDRVAADLTDVDASADSDAESGDDAVASGGFEPAVPRAVVEELDRLSTGAGEAATAAGVGLDLAREHCRVLDHDAEHGDAAVFECATREGARAAVTNDGPLRSRLIDADVPVISLRGGNKLAVTRP